MKILPIDTKFFEIHESCVRQLRTRFEALNMLRQYHRQYFEDAPSADIQFVIKIVSNKILFSLLLFSFLRLSVSNSNCDANNFQEQADDEREAVGCCQISRSN